MTFTEAEIEYLAGQRLGRIATVAPDGYPHNRPVGVHYNATEQTIDVVGYDLSDSTKWRNAAANPSVSFVVDDLASVQPWRPRGIEIRGDAELLRGPEVSPFGDEVIRVHPRRILTWGLDPDSPRAMVRRDVAPAG
ncbi:pyridoxamine 5'-phosphate oxidase family protein [Lipingzhangella halophila]|uniref:Pyridoxamine 5'-phosphate oxidase family protein n=1 Tax=Lipingzhangella halophila TaxID=1783352 RepID=A0A7W7RI53_9ACTN|nr:PPOX class F420-dependent oxidoreductase [Lipingzhangella halophila]MBB4932018.1 pyridoxamine 5'-phosphate oxidase family protein [Lipingzhangella halophila]